MSASEDQPIVDAPAGALAGFVQDALHVFKGIPYAEPPVGALRWKPPQEMARWQGVKDARQFGPACWHPQAGLVSVYSEHPMPMSEDCLTLNIWAPADAKDAPVFFWMHGGALVNGSSREGLFDGAKLAGRGMVVVTINYRLGVFGYLAHPELSAESALGISGNYGLLDQIAALEWVKHNIAAFGGDPANVTIAGESAGALSVMYLMASPLARGLFGKAIAQSAYMIATPELRESKFGLPSAEQSGVHLQQKLDATGIAALRAMEASKLVYAAPAAGYQPWGTVDGHILPGQLVDIFDKGEEAKVPILAGFNQGEIRTLKILVPPLPASSSDYEAIIRERYGDLADEFLRRYPAAGFEESILETIRDALYGWTAERLVRKQTALGVPSYLYLFDHGYPAADGAGLHAFHASELPFVFGTFDGTPPLWPKIPDSETERKFSDAMTDYWASFAKTAKPVAAGRPDWPAYDAQASYMAFGAEPRPAQRILPGMYVFNEEVMCRRRASGTQPWNWNVGVAAPVLPPASGQCE